MPLLVTFGIYELPLELRFACMNKSLAQSNPYMRDAATRERLVYRSVASSSAVEGIREPFRNKAAITRKSATGRISGPRR